MPLIPSDDFCSFPSSSFSSASSSPHSSLLPAFPPSFPPSSPSSANTSSSNNSSILAPRAHLSPFLDQHERADLIARLRPTEVAYMRRRLQQLPASGPDALSADPQVCEELWRMHRDCLTESLERLFSEEDETRAWDRVFGDDDELRSRAAVCGNLTAGGMGVNGGIFGGVAVDGPEAQRPAPAPEDQRTRERQREHELALVGLGSWFAKDHKEVFGDDAYTVSLEPASDAAEYGARPPLFDAGPLAWRSDFFTDQSRLPVAGPSS